MEGLSQDPTLFFPVNTVSSLTPDLELPLRARKPASGALLDALVPRERTLCALHAGPEHVGHYPVAPWEKGTTAAEPPGAMHGNRHCPTEDTTNCRLGTARAPCRSAASS